MSRVRSTSLRASALVFFFLVVAIPSCRHPQTRHIRIGITPYQDTALPIVSDKLGMYTAQGIDVEFVPLDWGNVMLALSSGSVDASIYTVNAFQPAYQAALSGNRKPVFYCPIYVFKGTAIMIHGNSNIKPLHTSPGESLQQLEADVAQYAKQLRGKRIAVTEGTEYEQIVLAALSLAGLNPKKDVTLVNAAPEDALAAFISGNIDAFGAGLTERMEARKHGAIELLTSADIGQPSLNGIVTTEGFALQNADVLDDIVSIWFKTADYVGVDPKQRSEPVRAYLAAHGSTKYTADEYAIAWTFDLFPTNANQAKQAFGTAASPYYWRTVWSSTNQFLIKQGKISSPVPDAAYWGDRVLDRIANSSQNQ